MARVCQISHVEQTFNFLQPLCRGLVESGHEVHVASTLDKGGALIRQYLGTLPIGVHSVPVARAITPSALTTDVLSLAKLFRHVRFDVVHVHGPLPSYQVRLAAAIARVPIVISHAHGFYFHDRMPQLQYGCAFAIEWLFCRYLTDALITINSEDHRLAVTRRFCSPVSRIQYVPGVGVDTTTFRAVQEDLKPRLAIRDSMGLRNTDILCTYVGRIVAEKGILELVSAFSTTSPSLPNVHLAIVGETLPSERDQRTLGRLHDLVAGTGCGSRVHLLGRREDVADILRASDLFCLPSHREGMPVSLMEAMSTSLPCIASDIRGCRDVVVHESTGLLFEAGDADSLARSLSRLCTDASLRDRLGAAARERIVQDFSIEATLPKQLALYESLLRGLE